MKTKLLRMIKSIKLFIMLFAGVVFAQESTVNGKLNQVKKDTLYRIHVPHNVRSYSANDLRDFRIWDTKGNQVPYFVEPTTAYKRTNISNFTEFAIISSTRIADSSATYIFKNPYKTIDQAVLLIANYKGNKSYRLEGSNNQKQWFGIVNSGQLFKLNHPTETSVYKVIHFPLCSYQYLKVVFDDRNSLPINLLKIGEGATETTTMETIAMEEIPVKATGFSENDQKTLIHVRFDRKELINQIRIGITAPDLYSRNATLYTIQKRKVKQKMESYRQPLATFSIRSDKDLVFDIAECIENEVYLEIDNKDNPKLQISGIHFMQEPIFLVASLKKSEKYTITAGNERLKFPDYDISSVTNTLKSELPIVQINSVVYVSPTKTIEKGTSFWQQSWFMWCCIGFSALIILYYAFNLIKDLDKNKDS
jgi:hypothetical protein